MPTEPDEMNTAVTRSELREELAATRAELREELAATRAELRAELASKADLTAMGAELRAEIVRSAGGLRAEMGAMRSAIYSDLAHLFRSFEESIIGRMVALLEPQNDHEPRIKALEVVVFAPSPPRKRRRGA